MTPETQQTLWLIMCCMVLKQPCIARGMCNGPACDEKEINCPGGSNDSGKREAKSSLTGSIVK